MACFHTAGVRCDECRAVPQTPAETTMAGLAVVYEENRMLREQVFRLAAALRDISKHLPCDRPCPAERVYCSKCGDKVPNWCAGCVARAALLDETP